MFYLLNEQFSVSRAMTEIVQYFYTLYIQFPTLAFSLSIYDYLNNCAGASMYF